MQRQAILTPSNCGGAPGSRDIWICFASSISLATRAFSSSASSFCWRSCSFAFISESIFTAWASWPARLERRSINGWVKSPTMEREKTERMPTGGFSFPGDGDMGERHDPFPLHELLGFRLWYYVGVVEKSGRVAQEGIADIGVDLGVDGPCR